MNSVFEVALVFSPNEWVESLHRYCTNTGELRISSLVYDPSVLSNEDFDACIISDNHPALSSGFVDKLHGEKKLVFGVCDEDENARLFLASAGVDAIFSSRLRAKDLCEKICQFLHTKVENENREAENKYVINNNRESKPEEPEAKFTSFIGTGGSGCTEIALALAQRFLDCVVVDVDFEHPSIAPRLGLDIEPHLISAIESSTNDPESFENNIQRSPKHSTIPGALHFSYSSDVKPYEIENLLECVGSRFENVVLDLGRVSENSLFFDLQKIILQNSHEIIVVGEPTPIGVLRTMESIATLKSIFIPNDVKQNVRVVINKTPKNKDLVMDVVSELLQIEEVESAYDFAYINDLIYKTWKQKVDQLNAWKKSINQFLLDVQQPITELPNKRENGVVRFDELEEVPA